MTLSLEKNASLALEKSLTEVRVGAGWDLKPGSSIDLDLFAIAYGDDGVNTIAYFNNKSIFDGAIVVGEDNRSGEDSNPVGVDELININLTKIPNNVRTIKVFLSSYSGESFDQVQGEFAIITDVVANKDLARTGVVEGTGKTLHFVDLVRSVSGGFSVTAVLTYNEKGFKDFVNAENVTQ